MKKTAKMWLRVLALVMALLMLFGISVSAADMDDVPYYSYTYWEGPSRLVPVPMRPMYEATQQILPESLGMLELYKSAIENGGADATYGVITEKSNLKTEWQHIVLTHDQSELYALDASGRIFVIDTKTLQLKRLIGNLSLTGEEYGIAAYQDITVTPNTEYALTFLTRRVEGTNAYSVGILNGETAIAVDGETMFDHEYNMSMEWVEHTITFNSGDATEIRLQFKSESTVLGKMAVDGVALTVAGGEENLVKNGEFTDGTDGWTVGLGATGGNMGRHIDGIEDKGLDLANYLSYAGSKGVYVTKEGALMICDTSNERLLLVNGDGSLERIITVPTGIEIPDDLKFQPERVVVDSKDYLYLSVGAGSRYGLLVYDEQFNFKGFHGAFKASADILENLTGLITNLFMTNEKAEAEKKNFADGFLDIAVDPEGFLYALSDPKSNQGQIKRMGLNGNQTLNFKSGFTTQSGDLLNFVETPKVYYPKGESFGLSSNLNSMSIDPQGYIYAADSVRGRMYVYDEECRLLAAFGLGFGQGDQVGTFYTPSAIAVTDDKLFVSDAQNCTITVFELTAYGALYKEADAMTINGKYEEAMPIWQQILKLDSNNQRAYEGLAKAYLALKDYDNAMFYAEKGNDQQTYSLAFTEVQKVWFSNNFWWVFLLGLAAVGAIVAILVVSKKRKIFEIKNLKLRTALSVPFHPFQAFGAMRTQKATSIWLAILFVIIFYVARVSQDLYGGFMYVIVDEANYNALFTLFGSVGILLLWTVTNWGICMLNDGKGSFAEVFCMSAYSMMPMIAYSLIFIVGSHLIPATNTDTFGMIGTILTIYMVLLLLIGMTVIHEYTFFKSMGMAIVTVLCMALAVFVLCAVVLLSQQFIVFIAGIINELRVR